MFLSHGEIIVIAGYVLICGVCTVLVLVKQVERAYVEENQKLKKQILDLQFRLSGKIK